MLRLVDQPRPLVWAAGSLVSPYYRALHDMRELPDWERVVLRRATYVPGGRFLYVHAPKAASSSIGALLRQSAPGLVSGAAHWREARPMLTGPDIYRFSFVLHPVTRALSTFHDLFVMGRHSYARRHWPQNRRVGLRYHDASADNFSRYLDYVEDAMAESALFCDPHLRLQVNNLHAGQVNYSRIGRVEQFEDDIAAIFTAIGLPFSAQMLTAERQRGAYVPEYKQASAAQIERIGRIYAADFSQFGYAPVPDA